MSVNRSITGTEPVLKSGPSPLLIIAIVALHVGGIYLLANLDFWPLRFDSTGTLVMVRLIPASATPHPAPLPPAAVAAKASPR